MTKKTEDVLNNLKNLHLFVNIPDKDLSFLKKVLVQETIQKGALIFDEGQPGDCLYFVIEGRVKILKHAWENRYKELAFLSAGDCFGEMALLHKDNRSARAEASEQTVVLKLNRADLEIWLKDRPELAAKFLAELVRLQSLRLGRTSAEMTLLYHFSQLLLESAGSSQELTQKALPRLIEYWEGKWDGAIYLYNQFNQGMELAASYGKWDFSSAVSKIQQDSKAELAWLENQTGAIGLIASKRLYGALLIHSPVLTTAQKDETERLLKAISPLLSSALENLDFRAEEEMRNRLKTARAHNDIL